MFARFVFLLVALAFYSQLPAQVKTDSLSTTQRFKQHVAVLAADSLQGRAPGTVYELKAANYLIRQLRSAGVIADTIGFTIRLTRDSLLNCYNVFGFIDNKTDSTILISAHHDHLGLGSNKSRELRKKGLHPGADDNASGVALALELAQQLQQRSFGKKYNYVFAFFTAHEMGLYGSYNFTRSPLFDLLHLKAALNFDMVGHLNPTTKTLRVSTCVQDTSLRSFLLPLQSSGLYIRADEAGETVNDFTVLCEHCVPAVSFTTGLHDDYHRMSDTADKINYGGIYQILAAVKLLLR